MLALAMSLLKTAGLWVIIVYFANGLLARPLRQWTEQVGQFDVANATQAPRVDLGRAQSVELSYLCDAFNDLADRVVANRSQLGELAATLERRVQERTLELSEKNRALQVEITVRKAAEQAVTRERDFSLALVRSIPEIFVLVTSAGGVVMSNPNAQRSLGLSETAGIKALDLVARDHRTAVAAMLAKVFAQGEASCEADLIFDGARVVPHYLIAHRVQLDDSVCSIVVAVDITARRQAEDQMRYLAMYDTLTDLPNRAMLHDRLGQVIAMAMRCEHSMAILFLDLDGFKAINDTFGHDAGDAVLRAVGKRLHQTVRASDLVARFGGDEFVIVLSSVVDEQAATHVAQKLIELVAEPIVWEGRAHRVGASVGISLLPDHAADALTLLECADAAMYRAKRRCKGCFELAEAAY
jgi:diguanylate cyclase (GGDEF)-like protein/PAS domain S-box-containing protein